jgi:hypothetical protein
MANTIDLHNYQTLIYQDAGDACEAILVWPEASGNLTWVNLHQRDNSINLNVDGAKELIKQLQWFVRNQEAVIKQCKV